MVKVLILLAGLCIIMRILFKWKIGLFLKNLACLIYEMGKKEIDDL